MNAYSVFKFNQQYQSTEGSLTTYGQNNKKMSTYNNDFFFFFFDTESSTASFVSRFLDFFPSLSFEPKIQTRKIRPVQD